MLVTYPGFSELSVGERAVAGVAGRGEVLDDEWTCTPVIFQEVG